MVPVAAARRRRPDLRAAGLPLRPRGPRPRRARGDARRRRERRPHPAAGRRRQGRSLRRCPSAPAARSAGRARSCRSGRRSARASGSGCGCPRTGCGCSSPAAPAAASRPPSTPPSPASSSPSRSSCSTSRCSRSSSWSPRPRRQRRRPGVRGLADVPRPAALPGRLARASSALRARRAGRRARRGRLHPRALRAGGPRRRGLARARSGCAPRSAGVLVGLLLVALPQMYGVGYPVLQAGRGRAVRARVPAAAAGRQAARHQPDPRHRRLRRHLRPVAVPRGDGRERARSTGSPRSPRASPARPGAYGLVGMAAVLAGATRAPITAVVIVAEITGEWALIVPLMIAVALATALYRLLSRETIYTLKLSRRGIHLGPGPRSHDGVSWGRPRSLTSRRVAVWSVWTCPTTDGRPRPPSFGSTAGCTRRRCCSPVPPTSSTPSAPHCGLTPAPGTALRREAPTRFIRQRTLRRLVSLPVRPMMSALTNVIAHLTDSVDEAGPGGARRARRRPRWCGRATPSGLRSAAADRENDPEQVGHAAHGGDIGPPPIAGREARRSATTVSRARTLRRSPMSGASGRCFG